MKKWIGIVLSIIILNDFVVPLPVFGKINRSEPVRIGVLADQRYYTGPGMFDSNQYFRGAVQSLYSTGTFDLIISPGDIDPPANSFWTIQQVFSTDFRWVPVVGNHELPGSGQESSYGANMSWLRSNDYGSVNQGPTGCPETTFSFDVRTLHVVVLNEYCDTSGDTVTNGDITDHLYNWLAADLEASTAQNIIVVGHEPAFVQPDMDNGRLRHVGDSLDAYPSRRDRFWNLLVNYDVLAYLCGHTHNTSLVRVNRVWQIDAGHARGLGDTGAKSTAIVLEIGDDWATIDIYRDDANGGAYTLYYQGDLIQSQILYLPIIKK